MGKFSVCCGSFVAVLAILVGWVGYLQIQLPELRVHYTPDGEEDHVDAYLSNVKGEEYYTDETLIIDMKPFMVLMKIPGFWNSFMAAMKFAEPLFNDPLTVHNARLFERSEGLSKAQFFEKHGFVLLNAPTAMTEYDWLNSSISQEEGSLGSDIAFDEHSPIGLKYGPEVKAMIGQLYEPGTVKQVMLPNMCVRRGDGSLAGSYIYGVHLDLENTYESFMKVNKVFNRGSFTEADHFESINFWRPVAPMKGPVRRAPLAVLDNNTVKKEDTFRQVLKNFSPGGAEQIQTYMRRAPGQKWYYYPEMTVDEVLVLKQVVYKGPEHDGNLEPVFHTAFDHPGTPDDAEPRRSSEYRVSVIF